MLYGLTSPFAKRLGREGVGFVGITQGGTVAGNVRASPDCKIPDLSDRVAGGRTRLVPRTFCIR